MTSASILREFLNNTAVLLALTVLYIFILPSLKHFPLRRQKILQGVLLGGIAIVSMLNASELRNGFLLDTRTILITLAGAFGGVVPASIASGMVISIRTLIGGMGLPIAVGSTFTAAVVGVIWYRAVRGNTAQFKTRCFVILGIIVGVQREIWTALLGGNAALEILYATMLPTMLIYPGGTLLIGKLLRWREQSFITEQELREREQHFRLLSEASFEGLAIIDQGMIIEANSALAAILGYTLEELIGKPINEVIAPESIAIVEQHIREKYEKPYEAIAIRKDGVRIDTEVRGRPIFYHGRWCRVSAMRDITERRQAQATLEYERDMLRTLIDHIPDYIFIKDAEGRFVVSNIAHAQAVQAAPEELVGKTAFEFFPAHLASQFHADDQSIMSSGQALVNVERISVRRDGSSQIVLTTKVPLRDRTGNCVGLVGISRDITARKEIEAQTVRLAIEQERVKALQQFIRDISHDLRTPLTVISTSAYFLEKLNDPEKQRERLHTIETQVQHLTHILDSMQQVSRLDTETEIFDLKPLQINRMIEEIVDGYQAVARTKHQKLSLMIDADLPSIAADEFSLKQAVEQVVKNALTYTPNEGEITISASKQERYVVIEVRDNGIGISSHDQALIFDHFYRVSEARPLVKGSAGLGLSIARRIIEAHDGRIEVQSEPGRGSTFRMMLPIVSLPDSLKPTGYLSHLQ
jgi:PAS domain S-box-containing protein